MAVSDYLVHAKFVSLRDAYICGFIYEFDGFYLRNNERNDSFACRLGFNQAEGGHKYIQISILTTQHIICFKTSFFSVASW